MNVHTILWEGISIEITFKPNYFKTVNVSHVEIRCDEPLPLTETGYRSNWYTGDVNNFDVIAYVVDGLNEAAKSKKWQTYLKILELEKMKSKQLSLF